LAALYPIPKHIFAETPTANWKLSEYNLEPVGSGPYRFKSLNKKSNGFVNDYSLVINPTFPEVKPYIETFRVRFFTNADDLIDAFNSGLVDGMGTIEANFLKAIKRTYKVTPFEMPSYYAVFLNRSESRVLDDIAVRKALALAIDRKALVKNVSGGYAREVGGPVLDNTPDASFDLEGAREMLDRSGWKLNGSVREKVSGRTTTTLSINLTVPDLEFLTQTAEFLKNSWESAGIAVNVQALALADISTVIKNRDYEGLLFGNIMNPPFDLYPFWHSSQRFYPGLNLAIYNNSRADALIEDIRNTTSLPEREEDLLAFAQLLDNEAPAVFLYSPQYLYISSKKLLGIETELVMDEADHLKNVAAWYVKTALSLK